MGRSQRHMLLVQNTTANGEIIAQGEIAPLSLVQVQEPALLSTELHGVEDLEVPVGPPGGPLQGSTLTGAVPESLVAPTPPGPELGPDPEPGLEPTLEYITPNEAVIGSTDFTLRVIGTNFTDTSVIVFNGGDEATTVVSDTELTTGVKPSTAQVAGALPVQVRQGSYTTGEVDFTFTEPVARSSRKKKS